MKMTLDSMPGHVKDFMENMRKKIPAAEGRGRDNYDLFTLESGGEEALLLESAGLLCSIRHNTRTGGCDLNITYNPSLDNEQYNRRVIDARPHGHVSFWLTTG